jgi:hypothetical protein
MCFYFYKTRYLNEEANCTELSLPVRVPCFIAINYRKLLSGAKSTHKIFVGPNPGERELINFKVNL